LRILHILVVGPLLSVGRRRSLGLMLAWKPNDPKDMAEAVRLVQAGVLVPAIDRTFSLEQVPEALEVMVAGAARGKLVITF
jgi:NADPH:quinone reductase-like Zn-dependent oxidoreductase